jgi:uncharacterized repeat protein (TIGR03803 family)
MNQVVQSNQEKKQMYPLGKSGMSLILATLWLCASESQIAAQTFTTLLSFDGTDGANSTAGLIRATDGNFYGTTSEGGANSAGTVFRISPSGVLTTIHSFCSLSGCSDGANPFGALIQATDGNLYGTTNGFAFHNTGTVFKITLSGALTTLTTFGNTGGQFPLAGLIQGKDGDLYGTTSRGGANICTLRPGYRPSCGTIFKITTGGTLTTLASFDQATGFAPSSPLIQGTDGNFYGTTPEGGANYPGFGTVFKVTATGTLTVLHSFDATDGEKSFAALVQGTDGNFYGTTSFGGGNPNFGGTVFKITPTGTLTTLHSFGSGDGTGASAALIQATDGDFYGTTSGYGVSNTGTVFKITPSGTLTTLHTFDVTDGRLPYSTLVEGANGNLYGTTEFGASSSCSEGCGTIFSLSVGLN